MNEDDASERVRMLEAENARLRRALCTDPSARLSERLTKREALLAEAERVAHLGSWVWDLKTGEITWSDEMFRILGFEPGSFEPTSARFFAAIDPIDSARVQEESRVTLETGKTSLSEFRIRRASGEVRKVRLESGLLTDEHGEHVHMVGTVLDLTDAQRSAELLFRTLEELKSAQRVARLGSFTWTFDPPRVEWSSGMYDLLGLSGSEEPSEGLFRQHVYPEDLDFLLSKRSEAIESGVSEPIAFRMLAADRSLLHVTLLAQPLRDTEGRLQGYRGVMQDVTRRFVLEEQLRQSQKMEALGTLAGGVAHDFNNYLMVLTGHTDLLRAGLGPDHRSLPSVTAIEQACDRCAALTSQLLTMSQRRPAEARSLDLAAVIRRMDSILRMALGERSTLSVVEDEPDAVILADPGHVDQVLMNLVLNARDAMPEGGALTLTLERAFREEVGDGGKNEARASRREGHASYVRLSVTDTGQGIAQEHRARIFEPFFTTKGGGHGTGLGLSTVYGIVQQAGGHIEVESELGRGTTFRVYWRSGSKSALEKPARFSEPPAREVPRTVLLVEDVDEVREVLKQQLERAGHRVLAAQNGAAALEIAAREREKIDIVVSDVVMPVMGGLELESRLAQLYPALPFLLMTGYADGVLRERTPSRHLLHKPYAVRELLSAIRNLCESAPART